MKNIRAAGCYTGKGESVNASFEQGEGIKETVQTYSAVILRLAYAYLKNSADAEDIAQEVFVAYMRKRPRFDCEAKKKAWLLKVTANKCKNVLKSAWNRRAGMPCDLSYLPEQDANVISLMLSLEEKYRIPMHLHYYEGYAINEIAKLLGAKPATVGTWLSRGRSLLRTVLEGEDG